MSCDNCIGYLFVSIYLTIYTQYCNITCEISNDHHILLVSSIILTRIMAVCSIMCSVIMYSFFMLLIGQFKIIEISFYDTHNVDT